MLSFPKLILVLALGGVLWYWMRRAKNRRGGDKSANPTIDLEKCATCGEWRNTPCGRDDCPAAEN